MSAEQDIEALARVAFEAYVKRMQSSKEVHFQKEIAPWDEQHAEVRASWRVATVELLAAYARGNRLHPVVSEKVCLKCGSPEANVILTNTPKDGVVCFDVYACKRRLEDTDRG